jgi:hypothetical protein
MGTATSRVTTPSRSSVKRACVLSRQVRTVKTSLRHRPSTGPFTSSGGTCDTACVTPACRASVHVTFGNGGRYSASLNIEISVSLTEDGVSARAIQSAFESEGNETNLSTTSQHSPDYCPSQDMATVYFHECAEGAAPEVTASTQATRMYIDRITGNLGREPADSACVKCHL